MLVKKHKSRFMGEDGDPQERASSEEGEGW